MIGESRLALLAHELRSPVAALVALSEASRATADVGRTRQMIELAIAAGRDIDRLLSDHDALSLRVERVDVGWLLDSLVAPRVAVSAPRGLEVDGDPVRLRQVLANLVANALRHATAVTIEARRHGDHVVIDVTDDGPGVAPGLDVFARGASGAGSSGYGLWLARSIAELHAGTLELVDREPPGACFRLVLPRASGVE